MKKVVLIHGKDTNLNQKWYPWLREEITKSGIEFIAPALPQAQDPVLAEWLEAISQTHPDDQTILIGHSRGGVAIMRWLEKQELDKKIKKLILIAANSGRLEDKAIASESNYGFYTEAGYDFDKIRGHCDQIVVFHSQDDPWVPFAHGQLNAAGLKAEMREFYDRGHFGNAMKTFPELLEEINK